MNSCPSAAQLRGLLAGELSEADDRDVAIHVQTCSRCQQLLEELTALDETATHDGRPGQPGLPGQPGGDLLRLRRLLSPLVPNSCPGVNKDYSGGLPRVPGYELLREVGRGGTGVVYEARQLALDRLVALKMVRSETVTADHLARFAAEAATLARLQHPNIVQIHEVGEHDGTPYLALEYVAGGTLAGRLAGRSLPVREAVALVETLARAMHYAHEAGVIHRDLKPANILLAFSDASQKRLAEQRFCEASFNEAVLKVTDFGLARQIHVDLGLTQTGTLLGTPRYMAPEQLRSRRSAIGPWTDVYALGVILYECLTGRPPFTAETGPELFDQIATEEPPPPSLLRRECRGDLETICLKCLDKEPRHRYVSARALAEDCAAFLAGRPISARPVGLLGRGWRWCRRNPAVASLLLAVLATLTLGAAVAAGFAIRAEQRAEGERRAKESAEDAKQRQRKQRRGRSWGRRWRGRRSDWSGGGSTGWGCC
jgi:serine/threonine protein kinase